MNRSVFVLAAFLLTCAASAAPAPKPLVSGWGNPIDPDNDCKIKRDNGVLTIEMPGMDHDYDTPRNAPRLVPEFGGKFELRMQERLNAPRLVREFEGDFEIRIRVRIDSLPSVKSTVKELPSLVAAGFLVFFPDTFWESFHRYQYGVTGAGKRADGYTAQLIRSVKGGLGCGACDKDSRSWLFKSKPEYVYMRLERKGILLHCEISPDEKRWASVGGVNIVGLPPKLKVGLAAFSTSTDPSKVIFDRLTITPGEKKVNWEFVRGWGGLVDPDKDCKIQRDREVLTMEMPGTEHDYDPLRRKFNAPRLVCDLEGDFDLEVRVRIDSRPSAQSTVKGQPASISAGFLLIHPEAGHPICDRLEYAVSQQGSRADANSVAPRLPGPRRQDAVPRGNGVDSYAAMKTWIASPQRNGNRIEWDHAKPRPFNNILWERGWKNWPLVEKAEYAYLRLDHREGWGIFYISPDGDKWTQLEYLPHLTAKCKVGLAAYSTSTERAKVRFDRLKLTRGKKRRS